MGTGRCVGARGRLSAALSGGVMGMEDELGSPSRADLHGSRRGRLRRTLAVALAGAVLAGGGMLTGIQPAAGQEADDGGDRAAAKAEWTFMTYMVADNNLEQDGLNDLLEMAGVGSTANVNIVVFVDRSAEFSEERVGNLPDFTSGKLLLVRDGEFEEIDDYGEIDSGNPQTLAWFIKTAAKLFPAKKYGLSLWDHGGGWQGYGSDDSAGSGMDMNEVVSGLAGGLQAAKVKKLEFLGFDACLMQTYEVAAAIAPFAKWFLASQELEPGHGWDYGGLKAIADKPKAKGKALGKSMLRAYMGQAEEQGTDAEVTLALVNLKNMPRIVGALKGFVTAATESIDDIAVRLATEGGNAISFGAKPDPAEAFNLVDLGDLLARLGEGVPDEVSVARASVYEALDRAVVDKVAGVTYEQATGMSVYLPLYEQYYLGDFYADVPDPAGWRSLLEAYYEAAGDIAPPGGALEFVGEPTLDVSAEGALITGQLPEGAGANIVAAYADMAVLDAEGSVVYLLTQPAGVGAGDPDAIQSGWGFSYIQISDGAQALPVYVWIDATESGFTASAEMLYEGASTSGEVTLTLTLDDEFNVVGSSLFLYQDNGTAAELTPEPGSTLTPLLLVVDPGGNVTFEPVGGALDATGNLGIDVAFLPSGTSFIYGLNAYDVAGNAAFTSAQGVVP